MKLKGHNFCLRIILPVSLNELQFNHLVTVIFSKKNFAPMVIFRLVTAFNCFSSLENSLQGVLDNKLNLPPEEASSLGIWDNAYQQLLISKSLADQEMLELENKAEPYELWEGINNKSWFYNQNNKIYLEITPLYPWHFEKPLPEENFIPFEEFMKNYKIFFREEIALVNAQECLQKTQKILKIIYKNSLGETH